MCYAKILLFAFERQRLHRKTAPELNSKTYDQQVHVHSLSLAEALCDTSNSLQKNKMSFYILPVVETVLSSVKMLELN